MLILLLQRKSSCLDSSLKAGYSMFYIGSVSGGYYGEAKKCQREATFMSFLGVGLMSALAFLCNMVVKVSIQWLRRL